MERLEPVEASSPFDLSHNNVFNRKLLNSFGMFWCREETTLMPKNLWIFYRSYPSIYPSFLSADVYSISPEHYLTLDRLPDI